MVNYCGLSYESRNFDLLFIDKTEILESDLVVFRVKARKMKVIQFM